MTVRAVADVRATPVPAEPSQAAEIADALIDVVRAHGSLKARLASVVESDVAPLFVLVRLVKDGPQRAKELAGQLCADQSTVSRQVAALVKAGLIERLADPDDGRASILVPTALGAARVQEHFAHRGQALAPVLVDWPEADRTVFLHLLRRYTAGLEARRDEVVEAMSGSGLRSPATPRIPLQSIPHDRIEGSL